MLTSFSDVMKTVFMAYVQWLLIMSVIAILDGLALIALLIADATTIPHALVESDSATSAKIGRLVKTVNFASKLG